MLLELAVGDAYGAGFEYADESVVKRFNDLSGYRKHQKYNIGNGRYTDDTQMSLAIAELIAEGVEWTPLNIANKFVDVFKRDAREGYAGRFYQFLQEVNSGKEFLERIHPESDKSGAAMRAGPIGFLPDLRKVIECATVQAKLTHDTPLGINAAVASALMSHYFIYNLGDRKGLGKFLENNVDGDWSEDWTEKVGQKGYMDIRAAITAIKQKSTLSGVLKRCIDFCGDVDTVATIAMAAASCSSEIKQDLPTNLINELENGVYGKDYLISLDNRLKNKFLGGKHGK